MLVSSSGGGAPQVKQQSWPVPHARPLAQLVMNKGAGVRSAGAWACPPARDVRNCAVAASVTGAGTDAGVWAMAACANARRARRTRTGFFIGCISLLADRVLDDSRAAGPLVAAQATGAVIGRVAAEEAAELARGAGGAVAAAGHERRRGRQVAGSLGLPTRQSGQELRGRRVGHRSRGRLRRLGQDLSERNESEKGEEDENGLLHTFHLRS